MESGDYAFITGSPPNNGRLVKIDRRPTADEDTFEGKPSWRVTSQSGVLLCQRKDGERVFDLSAVIPEAWLTLHRPAGSEARG